MSEYVGVDWGGKRWVTVAITNDEVDVASQPSIQAVWDRWKDADCTLVDIPIGLPDEPGDGPRPCDAEARDLIDGSRHSTVFDVPCRRAIQTSNYETAIEFVESLGPQKWGFAERIHEVDVFMRQTDTGGRLRESHPELCFSVLSAETPSIASKHSEDGRNARLEILRRYDDWLSAKFNEVLECVESKAPWKRRIGVGMMDDVVDAMVLAYTASLDAEDSLTALGGEYDEKSLPMEIVHPEHSEK